MRPLLIFDGDCGFCTSAARWAARGWSGPEEAVAWQALGEGRLRQLGLDDGQAARKVWWVEAPGPPVGGHRAIGRALRAARGWRHVAGTVVLTPPVSWLAAAGYHLVARNRHRLPGGTPACRDGA